MSNYINGLYASDFKFDFIKIPGKDFAKNFVCLKANDLQKNH